jgi:DegV family protein with EDD domain
MEELNIKVISLSVSFEDESFKEVDMQNSDFYDMMKKRGIPKSSQPFIGELHEVMKSTIDNGDSLLCIFLSSDMSGTYSSAHMVKEMISTECENAHIEILDSRSNCMQLGFAAIVAARAAKEGRSLEEVKVIAENNIKRSRFLFIPDNLEYLKKGGRIGGASALIGNLLKIIPILTVEDGKTTILTKVRTKKNAINTMIEKMLQDIAQFGIGEISVHHINCYEEAKELVDKIKVRIESNIHIQICDIGPVIGLHVGHGAIGIVYYTKEAMR